MGVRTLGNLVLAPGPNGDLVYHNGPNFWEETRFDWELAGPVGRVGIGLKLMFASPFLLLGTIASLIILAAELLSDWTTN